MGNHPLSDSVPDREVLSRRSMLGGVLGSALAGAASCPVLASSNAVMVVYVYADDCPPCQIFQVQDWPRFKASPISRAVNFVRTTAPKTTQAYQMRYWPSEARPFMSAIKVPIVPSFILVNRGNVVLVGNGIVGWRNQVLPQVHQLAAA